MFSNLEIALNEALQDEYKACATYRLVIRKFGAVRPFTRILQSEQRHIQALLPLFRKYNLPIPINHWEDQIEVPDTLREACLQGVQGEIENVEMYKRLLNLSQGYPDVQRVFRNLQRASQENHLRAFQRGAGMMTDETPNPFPSQSVVNSRPCHASRSHNSSSSCRQRRRRHRGGRRFA